MEVVILDISCMDSVNILWLVIEFWDSQSLFDLVDGQVCDMKLWESEGDIFSAPPHDIEEMFWDNSFNIVISTKSH